MANPTSDRKRQFRAALALRGLSVRQWALAQGYTLSHVYNYLNGKRDSRTLDVLVDDFIAVARQEAA